MQLINNSNGFPYWEEQDIKRRAFYVESISFAVQACLRSTNAAWHVMQIESPLLIALEKVNSAYGETDIFQTSNQLALRPETTLGSYHFLKHTLARHPKKWFKPPICIWQHGKSFRREQDQPTKYCRFKEFHQLEFQCLYTKSSSCDYMSKVIPALAAHIGRLLQQEVRIVDSDRLPKYSRKTKDLEIFYKNRWMEIASISLREDFDSGHLVLEIAFGLDRLVLATETKEL